MGKGINNIKSEIAVNSIFRDVGGLVTSTTTWEAGDILVFDDAANKVKAASAEADGLTVLGVAVQSVTNGVIFGPYTGITDNSAAIQAGALAGPVFGVEAELILATGSTIAAGDLVYISDAKTVAVTGTKAIGIYVGSKSITGSVAGQKIVVRMGARFPQDTLKF